MKKPKKALKKNQKTGKGSKKPYFGTLKKNTLAKISVRAQALIP